MKKPPEAFSARIPPASGARLASLRKAAGLSQVELTRAVGIPQRTFSFYETQTENLPSGSVPELAGALVASIYEILGLAQGKAARRVPRSRLERQFEAVRRLPRAEQEFVSKFLDNVLQHAQRPSTH